MYRPSALSLANTLADLPFSATRLFIYDVIVYFMAGLRTDAAAFFTFQLIVSIASRILANWQLIRFKTYTAYLSMQGFFRTFGLLCRTFDAAFRSATFFVPNMILYVGYMIPVFKMKRWLFWIVCVFRLRYCQATEAFVVLH